MLASTKPEPNANLASGSTPDALLRLGRFLAAG